VMSSNQIAPWPRADNDKAPENSTEITRRDTRTDEEDPYYEDPRSFKEKNPGTMPQFSSYNGFKASYFRDALTPPGLLSARSDFQEVWDLVLLLAMVYIVFITPFDVAYLGDPTFHGIIFWASRVLDLVFIIDMWCQFHTVPQHMEPQLEATYASYKPVNGDDTAHILSKTFCRKIGWEYARGWFGIDLIALLPYDLFAYLIEYSTGNRASSLRFIRIVRLLRLGKVLRVLKASRIVARYDDRVGIDFTKFRISTDLALMAVVAHWSACLLRFVVLIEGDDTGDNWIFHYFGKHADEIPSSEIYNVALYWAVETMTSVGYGDVLPQTQTEVAVSTIIMVIGASCMAFMIGSITSLMSALDLQSTEYYTLRAQLDEFVVNTKIPMSLAIKLRGYFRSQHQHGGIFDFSVVLDKLSDHLREQVAGTIQSRCLNQSPFFRLEGPAILSLVACNLEQRSIGAQEHLIRSGEDATTLYMIRKGLVVSDGRMLGAGSVVGEDMLYFAVHQACDLLARDELNLFISSEESKKLWRNGQWRAFSRQRPYNVQSVSFGIINVLENEGLLKVFSKHPRFLMRMRKNVVRHTFHVHMMAYTTAVHRAASKDDQYRGLVRNKCLVEWYYSKVRMTEKYAPPQCCPSIVNIQKNIRRYIVKSKFRQFVKTGLDDPGVRHRHVRQALERIELRLGDLEVMQDCCGSEESQEDESTDIDEENFAKEWKRMKGKFKQKLRARFKLPLRGANLS